MSQQITTVVDWVRYAQKYVYDLFDEITIQMQNAITSRDIGYRVKLELKLRSISIDPRKFSQKY